MNTAEVAIEHILAGLLALCAFALPFFSRPQISGKLGENAVIVGVLGAAYLFGVVFDRLADTILGPTEHYLRLSLADKSIKEGKPAFQEDPFPQDHLEFRLRRANDGRLEWMNSLRGRIRTSRALCVLGAPAAMGIAIFTHYNRDRVNVQWWPYVFVAVNLFLVFLSALVNLSDSPKETESNQEFPKTYELAARGDKPMEELKTKAFHRSSLYFLMLLLSLTVMAWISSGSGLKRVAIWICGAAVVSLSLLAWSQITKTYLGFIARQMPELLNEGKNQVDSQVGSKG